MHKSQGSIASSSSWVSPFCLHFYLYRIKTMINWSVIYGFQAGFDFWCNTCSKACCDSTPVDFDFSDLGISWDVFLILDLIDIAELLSSEQIDMWIVRGSINSRTGRFQTRKGMQKGKKSSWNSSDCFPCASPILWHSRLLLPKIRWWSLRCIKRFCFTFSFQVTAALVPAPCPLVLILSVFHVVCGRLNCPGA